jgi:hypothetical protein
MVMTENVRHAHKIHASVFTQLRMGLQIYNDISVEHPRRDYTSRLCWSVQLVPYEVQDILMLELGPNEEFAY